jgi:hypothetical protein
MAKWTEELYEWKVVEGTLEELLKRFYCIEGNVRDYGIDGWLRESGRLTAETPIEHASGNDLVAYAVSHRARESGCEKNPPREWKRSLEGIELTPEEDVRLAQIMREWIRTRN